MMTDTPFSFSFKLTPLNPDTISADSYNSVNRMGRGIMSNIDFSTWRTTKAYPNVFGKTITIDGDSYSIEIRLWPL